MITFATSSQFQCATTIPYVEHTVYCALSKSVMLQRYQILVVQTLTMTPPFLHVICPFSIIVSIKSSFPRHRNACDTLLLRHATRWRHACDTWPGACLHQYHSLYCFVLSALQHVRQTRVSLVNNRAKLTYTPEIYIHIASSHTDIIYSFYLHCQVVLCRVNVLLDRCYIHAICSCALIRMNNKNWNRLLESLFYDWLCNTWNQYTAYANINSYVFAMHISVHN